MVKKAIDKLRGKQLAEEEFFLGDQLTQTAADWLSEVASEPEGQLAVDVYQTEKEIVIKAPVAGVDEKDIDITVQTDQITIRGERKEEKEVENDAYHSKECYWGAFSRAVVLPAEGDPEKATATFKKGILTVRIPKAKKAQTVKLEITK